MFFIHEISIGKCCKCSHITCCIGLPPLMMRGVSRSKYKCIHNKYTWGIIHNKYTWGIPDPSLVPKLEAGLSGTYTANVSIPWYECLLDTQLVLCRRPRYYMLSVSRDHKVRCGSFGLFYCVFFC